jgi:hypothetical protein
MIPCPKSKMITHAVTIVKNVKCQLFAKRAFNSTKGKINLPKRMKFEEFYCLHERMPNKEIKFKHFYFQSTEIGRPGPVGLPVRQTVAKEVRSGLELVAVQVRSTVVRLAPGTRSRSDPAAKRIVRVRFLLKVKSFCLKYFCN